MEKLGYDYNFFENQAVSLGLTFYKCVEKLGYDYNLSRIMKTLYISNLNNVVEKLHYSSLSDIITVLLVYNIVIDSTATIGNNVTLCCNLTIKANVIIEDNAIVTVRDMLAILRDNDYPSYKPTFTVIIEPNVKINAGTNTNYIYNIEYDGPSYHNPIRKNFSIIDNDNILGCYADGAYNNLGTIGNKYTIILTSLN